MNITNLMLNAGYAFDDVTEWPESVGGGPRTPSLCWIFKIICQETESKQAYFTEFRVPESVVGRNEHSKAMVLHYNLQQALMSLEHHVTHRTGA